MHKEQCEKDRQLLLAVATDANPPNSLDYFAFDVDQTNKDSCIAMKQLLAPEVKVLSKLKDIQCQLILQQIIPSLCKELFDHKESCLRLELASLNHVAGGEQHGDADEMMMEAIENEI